MTNKNFIILIILYTIFFTWSLFLIIKKIYKTKKIELSDFFRLFYLFFYGLTPVCTLISIKAGKTNIIKAYYLESNKDYLKYIVFAITVLFYAIYNSFYKFLNKKEYNFKINKIPVISEKSSAFYIANIACLLIGWIALFLYTIAYGGIVETFKYAEQIRNNICPIKNNLTYFQPFTMILTIIPFNYLTLLKNMKDKTNKYKIITWSLFSISILGFIFVMLIIDSRSKMIISILITIYYFFKSELLRFDKKNIFKFSIIFLFVFTVLINSEDISGFLHNQNRTEQKHQINEFISQEFGFSYLNNVNIIYRKIHNLNGKIRIFDNMIGLSISLLPRSIQRKVTMNMHTYNTQLMHRKIGTIPSDLITSSVYSLGYIGPLIFPIWIAFIIYCLNQLVIKRQKEYDYYNILESYLAFYICLLLVYSYDLASIVFSCFDIILFVIIFSIFNTKLFKNIINKIYNYIE